MSTRVYTLTFAGPQTILGLPQGRFFMVKSASAALDIECERSDAQPVVFTNVGAGLQYNSLDAGKWQRMKVTSQVAQVVEIVISDEAEVSFANVVTVAGGVQVTETPFGAFATPADVTLASNTHQDIPANPSRRAVVIGALSTNAPASDNLRVRDTTGTGAQGIELQPGTSVRVPTSAAVRVRNPDANAQSFWYYEEV